MPVYLAHAMHVPSITQSLFSSNDSDSSRTRWKERASDRQPNEQMGSRNGKGVTAGEAETELKRRRGD